MLIVTFSFLNFLHFYMNFSLHSKIIKLLFCLLAGKCCWVKRVSELNVAVLRYALKPAARSLHLFIYILYLQNVIKQVHKTILAGLLSVLTENLVLTYALHNISLNTHDHHTRRACACIFPLPPVEKRKIESVSRVKPWQALCSAYEMDGYSDIHSK